jgi:hypothetical protein
MSTAPRLQPAPALTLVPRRHPRPRWTAADDEIMRSTYGTHTAATLAARLGRSVDGVRWRARTLGLATGHYSTPQEEIAHLRAEIAHLKRGALDAAHAPTVDARRLATLFACRWRGCRSRSARRPSWGWTWPGWRWEMSHDSQNYPVLRANLLYYDQRNTGARRCWKQPSPWHPRERTRDAARVYTGRGCALLVEGR